MFARISILSRPQRARFGALCIALVGVLHCGGGVRRDGPGASSGDVDGPNGDASSVSLPPIAAGEVRPPVGPQAEREERPRPCTGSGGGRPAVLCVTPSGNGNGTREAPFKTIQAAVDAAVDGDVVQVAAGTYAENVRVSRKTIRLEGGYSQDFGRRNRREFAARIRGNAEASVVDLNSAGDSTLDGFVITGGKGSREYEGYSEGGGVFVHDDGAPSHVTLSNNVVEGNDARASVGDPYRVRGGGIACDQCDTIHVVRNVVRKNFANRGGGIFAGAATKSVLVGNLIEENAGDSDHGGGVFAAGPLVELRGNFIRKNEIGRTLDFSWGGGVYITGEGTKFSMAFDVVTDNFSKGQSSGVFVDNGAKGTIEHALVFSNRCSSDGGDALFADSLDDSGTNGSEVNVRFSTLYQEPCAAQTVHMLFATGAKTIITLENSIAWEKGAEKVVTQDEKAALKASYSLTSGAVLPGTGNRNEDPLFADPARGDFHERSAFGRWQASPGNGDGAWVNDRQTSPAVDGANPEAPAGEEPAPNGGRANLGVYGGTREASRSAS